MNYQSEAFTYVLKQYLKGKKDNINFILISLRSLILEKCIKYQLKNEDIKVLLKFIIHGIDTYSFEKSFSFNNYINLYVDVSLEAYIKIRDLTNFELPDDEFLKFFIDNLQQSLEDEKVRTFNLN